MKVDLGEKFGSISVEVNQSKTSAYNLLMAHGAGAGYNHPFMEALAIALSDLSASVWRFNFPYMEQGRKSPGSPTVNQAIIGKMVDHIQKESPDLPIFLSGKSYGGRMSSHWVDDNPISQVKGLVYFGFPLHAPGRDGKERAQHLYNLTLPQLFLQGSRDKLANIDLIKQVVSDCQKADIQVLDYGDHSFKVPKKVTGMEFTDVIRWLASHTNSWILDLL